MAKRTVVYNGKGKKTVDVKKTEQDTEKKPQPSTKK
jgi:hypothetical protein